MAQRDALMWMMREKRASLSLSTLSTLSLWVCVCNFHKVTQQVLFSAAHLSPFFASRRDLMRQQQRSNNVNDPFFSILAKRGDRKICYKMKFNFTHKQQPNDDERVLANVQTRQKEEMKAMENIKMMRCLREFGEMCLNLIRKRS